jgi:prephenate dehydratase
MRIQPTDINEKIAIQGEFGSFSHEAALALAPQAQIMPCALSGEVFRCLVAGEVDAAVIPIENSLAGSVLEHYDLLLANDVLIEREHLLRVRHNLIAAPGATLASLSKVYSHPIALDQCRGFFRKHPHLHATPFYDTAGSVKHVLAKEQRDANAGAVASRQAAAEYGGVILVEGIEDNPQNYTRFFLVRTAARSREAGLTPAAAEANKVSLCFAVENRPGSLVAALEVFARQQIDLTKIESRPVPGSPWHYIFYADYRIEQPGKADAALAELAQHCSMVKELGRYAAAAKAL